VPTAVVSMPCALIFDKQDAGYQQAVLGDTLARVAVEAAVQMSWDRYLGLQGPLRWHARIRRIREDR
jgi:transketolase